MHYNIARELEPSPRPEVGPLVEACIRAMAEYLGAGIDSRIIISGDKEAIDRHVRRFIESFIDGHPEQFASLLKEHILGELVFRVVARCYFD
ncbi:MAG: hypothetical protein U0835_22675 [Isosphaeraceae bacterium]